MKIGAGGCSHSSDDYGNPWHYYMGKKLNAEIVSFSSSGAGNEMNIEKIKHILENNKLDLFVYQITDPARLIMGINNKIQNGFEHVLLSPNQFNGINYYTFNPHSNKENLRVIYDKDYDLVDEFMLENVISSDFNNKIKIFHTLLSINQLCDMYNVKCVFFSWFVNLQDLSKEVGYSEILKKLNVLDGHVNKFVVTNKIPFYTETDFHLGSESQELIYDNFIHPQLINYI
jgi:hypothetical protein